MSRPIAKLLIVLAALALLAGSPAHAQQAALNKLQQEFSALAQQHNYAQALIVGKEMLKLAEASFGTEHMNVAVSLNMLAGIYLSQKNYVEAAEHYQRALKMAEKLLGVDHPDIVVVLNGLGRVYSDQHQYIEAERVYRRALTTLEKAFGPDHLHVAGGLEKLAYLYEAQGKPAQAAPLAQRILTIGEKHFGSTGPELPLSLVHLADLHKIQGQYAQAEPLYQRALAIREKAVGATSPQLILNLNSLAEVHNNLGHYTQAEALYQRVLTILEQAYGPNDPITISVLNTLADLYVKQGQYTLAEPILKRLLAVREKALGPNQPDVALSLNALGHLYSTRGQYAQAEPLFKRTLAIYEEAYNNPHHPSVGTALNNLAELYRAQGRYAEAEPLFKRSLAINEKAFGSDHREVLTSLSNLALLYHHQGQSAQAEALYKRAVAIGEKTLGAEHPQVGLMLNNLAGVYTEQNQYAQAEPLYRRSLAITEKAYAADHPGVALSMRGVATLLSRQGKYAEALALARKASAIYRKRIVASGTGDAAVFESARNRGGFFHHMNLLARNPGKEAAEKIADESFQIVQLEQASGTASAIAKMAGRFARGDDALAGLIKRKQDAGDRRTKNEEQLVVASAKPPQERNATKEQGLRDDSDRAGKELEVIDAELTRRFPEYQELTRPEPISIKQVQAVLKPGEAMLVYALSDYMGYNFLWVIRRDGANFVPIYIDLKDANNRVAKVRAQMEFGPGGTLQRVDVNILNGLHHHLFGPALPYLGGITHVMLVPSGPLASLPFSMLVASPPAPIKSDTDYRAVDWLAKHYAFSVLPSVSSIQAFRQFAKAPGVQEPFAGFGDPLIGGANAITRGKRAKMDVASVFRNLVVNAGGKTAPASQNGEIADVEAIRSAPRLTETADELRAMARALKSDTKSVWLQQNATETMVKRLDLSKYRTLAFATHGVMAGEVKGIGEPGLILTPPQRGTPEDDGYLSSGEIAKLKLNADWVVLSACNTAAADGSPGAEGLSGLAKAFFYAGARSLLVSHWPVASEATVPLTTGMLQEYQANPTQGKAEAHRKAMLALMATPSHPEYSHPLFWAPFVVVGEGGAGSPANAKAH